MKDRNMVQLIGYLGADPRIKKYENGNMMARMRVATHTQKKEKEEANPKNITDWHTVVAWGKSAAFAERNFLKGSHILVDGKLIYRSFENKQGEKKTVTEIVANSMINLDR